MRRAWLRGGENLKKRYLVHVAGYNLGLVMRLLVGAGTPREFLARAAAHLLLLTAADGAVAAILVVATGTEAAPLYRSTVVRHRSAFMRPWAAGRAERPGPGPVSGSRAARRSRSGCKSA